MRSLSWSLYLACSWTWCIGMWLPSLLVRDGGPNAFLAFFIPNVIGAASVGWLLAGRAQAFYDSKRPIILAFTAVTIAFHAYWLLHRMAFPLYDLLPDIILGAVAGSSLVLNAIALTKKPRGLAAAVTLLISIAAAVGLAANPGSPPNAILPPADLAGLAAVCILGFGLCPYLDLTFNKAAIESKRPRLVFTLGFVVFGLILLIVTRGRTLWEGVNPLDTLNINVYVLSMLIGGHFGAQATFTCAAHIEALKTTTKRRIMSAEGLQLTLFPVLAALAVAAAILAIPVSSLFGMATQEIGYRTFLAAYGLVFPAWLLLTLGGRPAADSRTLIALAIAVALCLPFLAYGFISLEYAWVLPGLALLAIAVPVLRKTLVLEPIEHNARRLANEPAL